MANETKKYASLENLQTFKENADNLYATQEHTHEIEDVNDLREWMNDVAMVISAFPGHTHVISDVSDLQDALNAKVPKTRTINSKELSSDIALSASDVGADPSGSASSALSSANSYTDQAVAQKTQVQIITWEDSD